MKSQIALTQDQMHELKFLGLDCSDASMCWINGVLIADCDCKVMTSLRTMNIPIPTYTLEDIICKTNADILYRPTDKGTMEWRCQVQGSEYDDFNYFNGIGNTPLDAAFVMLKYALKEYPDKIKKLER